MKAHNEINSQAPNEFTLPSSPSSMKLGIVSLVLGSIGLILYFIPFIAGNIVGSIEIAMGVSNTVDKLDPVNVIGWFVSWCGNFLGLAALVLGGISIAKEKKNVFGVVGIILGTLLTCGCLASVAYNLSQM